MSEHIINYYRICALDMPDHVANFLGKERLDELMTAKEQKVYLKFADGIKLNENVVGASETIRDTVVVFGN